ncbi:conserved hypothetical protein [Nitrosococcus halophilus Nc 4]|uniref:Uncharacterized protein n=2 Tax=Nitrosococcus halophilus TaxID=133539 RepID=D5BZI3_NITHN|nr:conserved hypothetical protein [Nitrosococcus halophilus Nc 4]
MIKCLSLTLVRLIQLSAVVFYAYIMFIYVGALFLLPLAGIYHLSNALSFLGLPTLLAAMIAIAMVAGIIYLGYKIPSFFTTIRDFGLNLVSLGFDQIKQLNQIAEETKGSSSEGSSTSHHPT